MEIYVREVHSFLILLGHIFIGQNNGGRRNPRGNCDAIPRIFILPLRTIIRAITSAGRLCTNYGKNLCINNFTVRYGNPCACDWRPVHKPGCHWRGPFVLTYQQLSQAPRYNRVSALSPHAHCIAYSCLLFTLGRVSNHIFKCLIKLLPKL
jgi:hypothetical protein